MQFSIVLAAAAAVLVAPHVHGVHAATITRGLETRENTAAAAAAAAYSTNRFNSTTLTPVHSRHYALAMGQAPLHADHHSHFDTKEELELLFGAQDKDGKLFLANMTLGAPAGSPLVSMEAFDNMTTAVDCSTAGDGRIGLTFKDDRSFRYAIAAWDWVNPHENHTFVMIANAAGCGPAEQRVPYVVNRVTYFEEPGNYTAWLWATEKAWSEVTGTYKIDFGHVKDEHVPHGLDKRSFGSCILNPKACAKSVASQATSAAAVATSAVGSAAHTADAAITSAAAVATSAVESAAHTAGAAITSAAAVATSAVESAAHQAASTLESAASAASSGAMGAASTVQGAEGQAATALSQLPAAVQSQIAQASATLAAEFGHLQDYFGQVGSGSKNGTAKLDISVGTPNTPKTIWPVNATVVGSALAAGPRIECINCYIRGEFDVTGTIAFENFAPTTAAYTVAPRGVEMMLQLNAHFQPAAWSTYRIKLGEVPLTPFVIPFLFELGPSFDFEVEMGHAVGHAVDFDFGFSARLPDGAGVTNDMLHQQAATTSGGWEGVELRELPFKLNDGRVDVNMTVAPTAVLAFEVVAHPFLAYQAAFKYLMPKFTANLTTTACETCNRSDANAAVVGKRTLDFELEFVVGQDAFKNAQEYYTKTLYENSTSLPDLCLPLKYVCPSNGSASA